MITLERLKEIRDKEIKDMEYFSSQVREHIEIYGSRPCDYLNYRREMSNFHRGRANILIDIIRECEGK